MFHRSQPQSYLLTNKLLARVGTWRLLWAAMFLAAAVSAMASEVTFPAAKFESGDPDEKLTAQLFKPNGAGPHPAVVLLQTCGGQTQHMTHDWPRFLTDLGYVVLAVDTLGSRGYHKGCSSMKRRLVTQARDAYGALDYLNVQGYVDPRRIAAAGFSLGAVTINNYIMARAKRPADQPEFSAFASFYGWCRNMKPDAVRETPLLQVIAEKDEQHAPSCIERAKSIRMEAHVLPGVHHAFDQPQFTTMRTDFNGSQMLYDPGATEAARKLLRDFLATHLK